MSDSIQSPLLAAFIDLVEVERAYAEQVKTAETHAQQQREEARRAREQRVRSADGLINERNSLPEQMELSFVRRGLPIPTHTDAPPTMAGDGDAEAKFRSALRRVDDLVAALERSWRDYDEAKAAEAAAARRLLAAVGAVVVAVVLGALAPASWIRERQAAPTLTADALTRVQANRFVNATATTNALTRMQATQFANATATADQMTWVHIILIAEAPHLLDVTPDSARNTAATGSVDEETVAAYQAFQRRYMIWLQSNDTIYVLFQNGTWEQFADLFNEGMMETDLGITAPDGLVQPRRGFGLIWRQHRHVRDALGWGLHIETGYIAQHSYSSATGERLLNSPENQRFILDRSGYWTGY